MKQRKMTAGMMLQKRIEYYRPKKIGKCFEHDLTVRTAQIIDIFCEAILLAKISPENKKGNQKPDCLFWNSSGNSYREYEPIETGYPADYHYAVNSFIYRTLKRTIFDAVTSHLIIWHSPPTAQFQSFNSKYFKPR